MAKPITADISGIIRELNIPVSNVLYPFFEAVVNSIQAIQEREDITMSEGKISIIVERDKMQQQLFETYSNYPIKKITIKDNGIGFTPDNYESFSQAYSSKKAKLGGKGLGRFAMLSVFKSISVKSIFAKSNGDKMYSCFSMSSEGLSEPKEDVTKNAVGTEIVLDSIRDKYIKETAKYNQEAIADNILKHCLLYYLNDDKPNIEIIEDDLVINLDNQFLPSDFIKHSKNDTLEGKDFTWYVVKNEKNSYHELSLCAHNRKVKGKKLDKIIPVFASPMTDSDNPYYLTLYVIGKYLDERVNSARNGFDFPKPSEENESTDLGLSSERLLTEKDIEQAAARIIKELYPEEMQRRTTETCEKVGKFLATDEGLEYRHLPINDDFLSTIPNDADDKTIDDVLHSYQFQVAKENKKKRDKLFKRDYSNSTDYQELLNEVLKNTTTEGNSRLAQYVSHRRTIIRLLEKYLSWSYENNNYEEENVLHNLIYTMGGTTETIPYDKHNLWLLDDRLTFHRYIYSDKQIKSHKPAEGSTSEKETDIAIYDVPFTYGELGEYGNVNSVVIFELKRPNRQVTYEEFSKQMREQIRGIRDGKIVDYKKRHVVTNSSTPVFFYYVCDANAYAALKENCIEYENFIETPYKSLMRVTGGNVVQEIMTYQVVLENAKRRNAIFFKKLGVN